MSIALVQYVLQEAPRSIAKVFRHLLFDALFKRVAQCVAAQLGKQFTNAGEVRAAILANLISKGGSTFYRPLYVAIELIYWYGL